MISKFTLFTAMLVIPGIYSYAQQPDLVKEPTALKMKGAYTLLKQTINDSTINVQQQKMFTDKYMMYAHKRAQDSLAEYGIGTYRIENGKVIENILYTNQGPRSNTFELVVAKEGDSYSQVINFPVDSQGTTAILTESYKSIGSNLVTPLDGTWKQIKSVTIMNDGKTVVTDDPIQFKMYESGNFLWTHSWKDDKGNLLSSYGYGNFRMDGNNKAVETPTSSTYSTELEGKAINLDLKFIGKDKYEQTILYPDGTRTTETYERMK